METRIELARCRALLEPEDSARLTNEQVIALRDFVYDLAGVVLDAYLDLDTIDQSLFETRPFYPDELNPTFGEAQ